MKRISQLDGVRGVAIILVLVHHYFCLQVAPAIKTPLAYFNDALNLSWSGVDLFFVLSGFLIAGILIDHRGATNGLPVFYLRRICRIFPLYFLMLVLFFCLSSMVFSESPAFRWLFHDPFPAWSYLTFTQNYFVGTFHDYGPKWLSVTWSLAIEEQFYLMMPLVVRFLPRRVLGGAIVAGILGAVLLRCWSPGFHSFVDLPWRADALLCGGLLALLVRWEPFINTVRRHPLFVRTLFFIFLAGTAVMTLRPAEFGAFNLLWLAGLYSVFVLMAFAETEPVIGYLLRSPAMVWVGQISYGVYLFQQPVSGLLHGLIRNSAPQMLNLADAGVTLLAVGVTLLLAHLSFHFFERPILRFAHRFQYFDAVSK